MLSFFFALFFFWSLFIQFGAIVIIVRKDKAIFCVCFVLFCFLSTSSVVVMTLLLVKEKRRLAKRK